jgi:DNA-binding CsgD family transcriptional regulator
MKTLDRAYFGVFIHLRRCDDPGMARPALAVLGAALGLYSIALGLWKPGVLTLPAPVHVAIGWSFLAAGLVAWRQRPENRLGLLMTITGVVWFGRDFDWFGSATAHHASELSQNLFLALLVHQIVVFPYGVARAHIERMLVAAAYALALLGYPPSELSNGANTVLSALAIALVPVVVYVVVERWLRAPPPDRRAVQPLVVIGPAVLVVAGVSIAHDYLDVSFSAAGAEAVRWAALAYTAIPLAFLLGVLRARVRRVLLAGLLTELREGVGFDDETLDAVRRTLREERPLPQLEQLTARETQVLALIAEGRTDRGIAKELYVTPKTVEAHVRSIFRKLDLPIDASENRRVHAVLTYLRARTP